MKLTKIKKKLIKYDAEGNKDLIMDILDEWNLFWYKKIQKQKEIANKNNSETLDNDIVLWACIFHWAKIFDIKNKKNKRIISMSEYIDEEFIKTEDIDEYEDIFIAIKTFVVLNNIHRR